MKYPLEKGGKERERERERNDGAEKEIPRDLVASILRSNSKRAAAIKVGGDGSRIANAI